MKTANAGHDTGMKLSRFFKVQCSFSFSIWYRCTRK